MFPLERRAGAPELDELVAQAGHVGCREAVSLRRALDGDDIVGVYDAAAALVGALADAGVGGDLGVRLCAALPRRDSELLAAVVCDQVSYRRERPGYEVDAGWVFFGVTVPQEDVGVVVAAAEGACNAVAAGTSVGAAFAAAGATVEQAVGDGYLDAGALGVAFAACAGLCAELCDARARVAFLAFRRLANKCQVFIAPRDAHLRTRLTHALEVDQVATAIARAVGLNTALTEAAAIAHDCGHGPAGHASEEAFGPFLAGGYDHATYGADVVLAPLNLCAETLDAVRNHSWRRPTPATPEGEVVAWADRIAYVAHDWDDAVRAGIVTVDDLPDEVADVVGVTQSSQLGAFIGAIVACVEATGRIGMLEPYASALDELRRVNYRLIYLRPLARRQAERVIELLTGLVEYYLDAPGKIPDVAAGLVERPASGSPEAAEAAVRYVPSMTDRFAIAQGIDLLGFAPERLPAGV